MQALLDAIGSFGKLGAEAMTASEEQRARIRADAEAAWQAYKASLEGFWAGISADDAEMAALAKPLAPAAAPAAPAQPVQPTPPIVSPQPSGVE